MVAIKPLKVINLTDQSFVANGKTYLIETSLSVDRYRTFEQIEIELGYGRSFADLFDVIREAYDLLNKSKPADAAVKLYNVLNGVSNLDVKRPHVFRYCALFMNEEHEDRSTITEDVINSKVADWEAEGLDYVPFFSFALASLAGYRERFQKLTEDISNLKLEK